MDFSCHNCTNKSEKCPLRLSFIDERSELYGGICMTDGQYAIKEVKIFFQAEVCYFT